MGNPDNSNHSPPFTARERSVNSTKPHYAALPTARESPGLSYVCGRMACGVGPTACCTSKRVHRNAPHRRDCRCSDFLSHPLSACGQQAPPLDTPHVTINLSPPDEAGPRRLTIGVRRGALQRTCLGPEAALCRCGWGESAGVLQRGTAEERRHGH